MSCGERMATIIGKWQRKVERIGEINDERAQEGASTGLAQHAIPIQNHECSNTLLRFPIGLFPRSSGWLAEPSQIPLGMVQPRVGAREIGADDSPVLGIIGMEVLEVMIGEQQGSSLDFRPTQRLRVCEEVSFDHRSEQMEGAAERDLRQAAVLSEGRVI